MLMRILAILTCVALAACTSSEATVNGDTVIVKIDGSALLYEVETLTMVAKEKATSVCLAHRGAEANLVEPTKVKVNNDSNASSPMQFLSIVQVIKRSGFLDMFPAHSVTRQWKCELKADD